MYGRAWLLDEAAPLTMELVSWVREEMQQELRIRERLVGLGADDYALQLHAHLRLVFGLPDWETLLFAPETVAGARFISRLGIAGCGCSTIIPFRGGELELYRTGADAIGTLYSFELDWREGVRLLGGLNHENLAGIAFWFARASLELRVTFPEYLEMIATREVG